MTRFSVKAAEPESTELSDVKLDAEPSDVKLDAESSDVKLDAEPSDVKLDTEPSDVMLDAESIDVNLGAEPSDVKLGAEPSDEKLEAETRFVSESEEDPLLSSSLGIPKSAMHDSNISKDDDYSPKEVRFNIELGQKPPTQSKLLDTVRVDKTGTPAPIHHLLVYVRVYVRVWYPSATSVSAGRC